VKSTINININMLALVVVGFLCLAGTSSKSIEQAAVAEDRTSGHHQEKLEAFVKTLSHHDQKAIHEFKAAALKLKSEGRIGWWGQPQNGAKEGAPGTCRKGWKATSKGRTGLERTMSTRMSAEKCDMVAKAASADNWTWRDQEHNEQWRIRRQCIITVGPITPTRANNWMFGNTGCKFPDAEEEEAASDEEAEEDDDEEAEEEDDEEAEEDDDEEDEEASEEESDEE